MSDLHAALDWLSTVAWQGSPMVQTIQTVEVAARSFSRLTESCGTCGGSGKVRIKRPNNSVFDVPCRRCDGRGWVFPEGLVEAASQALDEAARVDILIPNMAHAVLSAVVSYIEEGE